MPRRLAGRLDFCDIDRDMHAKMKPLAARCALWFAVFCSVQVIVRGKRNIIYNVSQHSTEKLMIVCKIEVLLYASLYNNNTVICQKSTPFII